MAVHLRAGKVSGTREYRHARRGVVTIADDHRIELQITSAALIGDVHAPPALVVAAHLYNCCIEPDVFEYVEVTCKTLEVFAHTGVAGKSRPVVGAAARAVERVVAVRHQIARQIGA